MSSVPERTFASMIAARSVHAPLESAHTPSPRDASAVSRTESTTKGSLAEGEVEARTVCKGAKLTTTIAAESMKRTHTHCTRSNGPPSSRPATRAKAEDPEGWRRTSRSLVRTGGGAATRRQLRMLLTADPGQAGARLDPGMRPMTPTCPQGLETLLLAPDVDLVLAPSTYGTARLHRSRHRHGYTMHEAKELVDHSPIKTTSDIYVHLFADDKKKKAADLSALLVASPSSTSGDVVPIEGHDEAVWSLDSSGSSA